MEITRIQNISFKKCLDQIKIPGSWNNVFYQIFEKAAKPNNMNIG